MPTGRAAQFRYLTSPEPPRRAAHRGHFVDTATTLRLSIQILTQPPLDLIIANSIYYGIKTGFNDAFVVTQAVRDRLVTEDPASEELLKPILRGRDIRRYHAQWAGLWLVDVHNGYDRERPVDIMAYPAIKAHLDRYYARLVARQDRGVTPYHLRNCAYHAQFCGEKLFWPDLAPHGRFVISATEMYCSNTGYIITGPELRYLCAFLNSPLIAWYLQKTALTTGEGLIRWIRSTVERIPIPPPRESHAGLVQLVERRSQIATDPARSWKNTDYHIDDLVYKQYGLDADEVLYIKRHSEPSS